MARVPTFADWARDPQCIDRYLAALNTLPLGELGPGTLRLLADYLFQAAHNKVVSASSYASLAAYRAADDPDAHEATRQGFLAEATMFETAGRIFRDLANDQERASMPALFPNERKSDVTG